MARPVRIIKSAPPVLSGPPPEDEHDPPEDWEGNTHGNPMYPTDGDNSRHNDYHGEPDSMSMEGLGGEEVIPYMNETELKDGANKWNYINPDSPNPYQVEMNRRIVDSQHGNVIPFETADSRDFVNEMERREKGGEAEEWSRAAREDKIIPSIAGKYQHRLRNAPDVDLQTDMYQQMMQNDPLNPTFTAGDPMDLAFRFLKAIDTQDYDLYGSVAVWKHRLSDAEGEYPDDPAKAQDYEEAAHTGGLLRIPNTVGGLVGGQDQPLTQGMARQLYAGQQGEIGDVHAGHDILSDPRYLDGGYEPENKGSTLFSESGKSQPWRRHPGFDESTEGQDMSMEDPHSWEDPDPTPHPYEGSKLDGQALAMLHQRQQHELPDFAGQRAKQEEIERQASMERQMQQRMAETRAAPSAAPPTSGWDNSMPDPPSDAHSAAMQKLAQRQAANIARQRAQKDALDSRRRRKFSRGR